VEVEITEFILLITAIKRINYIPPENNLQRAVSELL
jgi:hypothetical protein